MKNTDNKTGKISFFKAPITNTIPYKNITLSDAFKYITGEYCKFQTHTLRLITDKKQNKKYKADNFPFVTISGTFGHRSKKGLIEHSGLMVLDFDEQEDVEAVKIKLLKDPCFETQLLFISPNGKGLKWVIEIDINEKYSHGQWFDAVFYYIKSTHGIKVDESGSDVSRPCFISYDPTAFIHPKYLTDEEI